MEELAHCLHRFVDVVEEDLEAGAEVVEAGLPVRCRYESVLRAAAVTCEAHFALATILRQCGQLVLPKLQLLIRSDQFNHVFLFDVAQFVLWSDEMVAGVQIAIMFNDQRSSAGF